jgi:anti-anti-sigma regulatory factor
MLMITEEQTEVMLTFKLAGALAGDWASELERCWREAAESSAPRQVVIDLTEVAFVDDTGKALLTLMAEAGAELIAHDILMKSIVDEIANREVASID